MTCKTSHQHCLSALPFSTPSCLPNCFKLDKTNGQTKWTEFNQLPSFLTDVPSYRTDGRSFINTPKGVYAFGYGGIAFLPNGQKEWTEGPKPPESDFQFYYTCPVLISDNEILLLGGSLSYGTQVIKNWAHSMTINKCFLGASRVVEFKLLEKFHTHN